MKIEKTIKISLENEEHNAVIRVFDVATAIHERMMDDDICYINGSEYDRDHIEEVISFLTDLWQNGGCACEIAEP